MTDSDLFQRYGSWALVTGASSGIGEHFARALATIGFHLIITARRTDRLQHLATELQADHGINVETLSLDLAADDFLTPLMQACAGKELGLVICNAGFGLKGEHQLQDIDQLDNMLKVNARAPMLIARALTPQLAQRDRSAFIFTSSIEGFIAFPYSTGYAASKAFCLSLGEGLAHELKPQGIDVLILAPGSTDTEALTLQGFDPKDLSGLMSPREVASQTLHQLGRKTIFIPGKANAFMVGLLSILPRRWATFLAGKGMQAALK